MVPSRELTKAVAGLTTVSVSGLYYRVTSQKRIAQAFDGSRKGGRWGPTESFPVIYLGDTYDGVVIETHRHVTDTSADPVAPPVRLGLISCEVAVNDIVDLRSHAARFAVGLGDRAIIYSEPQNIETGEAYLACQSVALAAHQLGRHGIIVPSATQVGHTLALFADHLTDAERPAPVGGIATWSAMPADPRRLRIIQPMPSEGDDPGV